MSGQSGGKTRRVVEPMGKLVVQNHGHAPAERHRQETRAIEKKTRQQGKKEIRRAMRGESVAECIAALRATL